MPGSFFDTNVLMYLATIDERKADRVEQLLRLRGTISVQILNEITNVARRKFAMSWGDTFTLLSTARSHLAVVPLTIEIHAAGLRLAERYGFAIYDAMVVAAALSADCETLWSEDMQDGLLVDKRLMIVNPFGGMPTP
jgi:predicted nucleic acid-binding protein